MSSRALRRLQKEQEQKRQLEQSSRPISEDEDEDAGTDPSPPKASNAFDMLNAGNDDENVSDQASSSDGDAIASASPKQTNGTAAPSTASNTKAKSTKKKKKKNKSGKDKASSPNKPSDHGARADHQDEIDAALASLSMKSQDGSYAMTNVRQDDSKLDLCRLLAIESKHLNAMNEMKRLFGNIMTEDDTPSPDRRRGRGPQTLDLGSALTARYSPLSKGQGLSGLALRRNVFISGKEEWPKAPSGGLGMEIEEKDKDSIKHYRFVHNTAYQDVQQQFESCVESMDPQRMISMLQFNPYHISTLLQVSDIAKHQGDHSVSGDLLERALFSFGRSVQSSFSNALAEGKARLDFRRPENREFWLAAWRYMANLGQRGTWRTAYEWAKLLLSLDPEGDPYAIMMVIDQLALRGGQSEHFLEMASHKVFEKHYPNIDISKSLAEYKLKLAKPCRITLDHAVTTYPWIFARLFRELNIEHVPPSIWGTEPRTARETFDCETYVLGAKDLWNTPENIQFLVEVVEYASKNPSPPVCNNPTTLSEARHLLLTGNPQLIALLPRSFTSMPSSASDPLPPPDNIESYSTAPPQPSRATAPAAYAGPFDSDSEDAPPSPLDSSPATPPLVPVPTDDTAPGGLRGLFSRLMAWPNPNADPPPQMTTDPPVQTNEDPAPQAQDIPRALRGFAEIDRGWAERVAEVLANQPEARQQATVESDPDSETEVSPGYDEDKNKRWLAGQGMQAVKAFVEAHGSDEGRWSADVEIGNVVRVYAERLKLLRETNRRFIVDYALPQGAGREAKELVRRMME